MNMHSKNNYFLLHKSSSHFGDTGSEASLGQTTILRVKHQPIIFFKKCYQTITHFVKASFD